VTAAYILDLACGPACGQPNGSSSDPGGLADWIVGTIRLLAESAHVRPTDIHDIIVGQPRAGLGGDHLLAQLNCNEQLGGTITSYLVSRGDASGLQALGLAALSALSGQHDVIVCAGGQVLSGRPAAAAAVRPAHGSDAGTLPHPGREDARHYVALMADRAARAKADGELAGFGVAPAAAPGRAQAAGQEVPQAAGLEAPQAGSSEAPRAGGQEAAPAQVSAAAAAVIATELFAARAGLRPRARIRRFTTAAGYDGPGCDGMKEAAVRLLMNQTLNVADVDLWDIYDRSAAAAVATIAGLDLDMDRVNVAGGLLALGDAGGATTIRSVVATLSALASRGLRTAVLLAPGPGNTGAGLLIERT
jgi:acetyl-CoA C-acetyltransferase